jgi:hypothetical protein
MDHAVTVQADHRIAELLQSEVDLRGIGQADRAIKIIIVDFWGQP